jgi:enediyne biosynthesis protein E4
VDSRATSARACCSTSRSTRPNGAGLGDLFDGRAVATADFFHRGRLDLVIANQQGPLLFYENEVDPARHWIQFELQGTRSNRSAIGAEVTLFFGGVRTVQAVLAGSGFCSQNELALHFGLGAHEAPEKAVIRWPTGAEQVIPAPAIDRRHHVEEP